MPFHGCIVVIKRSGADGSTFPLVNEECLLGRSEGCDIRIQLPIVSKEHCKIIVNEEAQVSLVNLSKTNKTTLNGKAIPLGAPVSLGHKDVFMVGDRYFRWEFPEGTSMAVGSPVRDNGASISGVPEDSKCLTPLAKAPVTPMEIFKRTLDDSAQGAVRESGGPALLSVNRNFL